jgi:diguanylate cyclase (GGDEF)-like protein
MHQPTHRRHAAIAAVLVAVVGGGALAGLPTADAAPTLSNVGQVLAPLLAAWACFGASRRVGAGRQALGWRLLGGSALAWGLGQAVWTLYDLTGARAPFPSLADVGYLAAVPLALAGIVALSHRPSAAAQLVAGLDGLIIACGLLAISWPLVLGPTWEAGEGGALEVVLSLAYPVGNIVVASVVLLALVLANSRRDAAPLAQIGAALVVLALADSVFAYTALKGTEQEVSIADVGWMAGYATLFLAAIRSPLAVTVERSDARVPPSLRRAALPLLVVSVVWVFRLAWTVAGNGSDAGLMPVLTLVVVGLLLVRYLLTLRENQQLTSSLEEKIDELTAREEQLSHQALHDPLTGLANRRLFSDRVEHALNRSRRTGDLTAVLFVDLDDFKTVNDSLGHAAGDRLLASVAARLSGCVRPGDTVARLGGDEFGVLLEEVEGRDHAVAVARRILESLDVAFPLDGRQVFTRASVGLAIADAASGHAGADLLSDADVALYAAKGSGKSTYREFERAMRVHALERLELGQDLRRALHQDQFFCHYQPIVDLVTGKVVAIEALLRWDHPSRGLVAPNSFIELAEESGMIGDIGMAVLQMSAWQAANWRTEGKVPKALELHVNLSGRQLEDPFLVEKVRRVLGSTGFPGQLLVLEITESVAVEVGAQHIEVLNQLRSLGIRVAIDDFGTGYSSLNYLRALPVDVLKIDRAFASTVDGKTDTVLLEAIVRLGHSLGIDMIAEGIEHEEQVVALKRLGCRRAQGFLFHRPLAVSEIPAIVAGVVAPPLPTVPARPPAPARSGSNGTARPTGAPRAGQAPVGGPAARRPQPAATPPTPPATSPTPPTTSPTPPTTSPAPGPSATGAPGRSPVPPRVRRPDRR